MMIEMEYRSKPIESDRVIEMEYRSKPSESDRVIEMEYRSKPSESDRVIVESFFKDHCMGSRARLGRLDVDCWSVSRRVVAFLSQINPGTSPAHAHTPRRVRWIIHNPANSDDPDNGYISHWVVEWKRFVVDAAVMQFFELDTVLDNEGMELLRNRCYSPMEDMSFKSCSDIHPPWVHDRVSKGRHHKAFSRNLVTTPYFFGPEDDHPVRAFAQVVRLQPTKQTVCN